MDIKNVTLTEEQWQDYIDEIQNTAPIIANVLKQMNFEGEGQKDHDDYLTSQLAAIAAMSYVKAFAADKVQFGTIIL